MPSASHSNGAGISTTRGGQLPHPLTPEKRTTLRRGHNSQTVKTTRTPGDRGYDGGKKGKGPQAVHPDRLARADLGVVGDDRRPAGPGRRAVAPEPGPRGAAAVA